MHAMRYGEYNDCYIYSCPDCASRIVHKLQDSIITPMLFGKCNTYVAHSHTCPITNVIFTKIHAKYFPNEGFSLNQWKLTNTARRQLICVLKKQIHPGS